MLEGWERETPFDPNATPIWEQLIAIGQSIPLEEWAKIPNDLSSNLDDFLYNRSLRGRIKETGDFPRIRSSNRNMGAQ